MSPSAHHESQQVYMSEAPHIHNLEYVKSFVQDSHFEIGLFDSLLNHIQEEQDNVDVEMYDDVISLVNGLSEVIQTSLSAITVTEESEGVQLLLEQTQNQQQELLQSIIKDTNENYIRKIKNVEYKNITDRIHIVQCFMNYILGTLYIDSEEGSADRTAIISFSDTKQFMHKVNIATVDIQNYIDFFKTNDNLLSLVSFLETIYSHVKTTVLELSQFLQSSKNTMTELNVYKRHIILYIRKLTQKTQHALSLHVFKLLLDTISANEQSDLETFKTFVDEQISLYIQSTQNTLIQCEVLLLNVWSHYFHLQNEAGALPTTSETLMELRSKNYKHVMEPLFSLDLHTANSAITSVLATSELNITMNILDEHLYVIFNDMFEKYKNSTLILDNFVYTIRKKCDEFVNVVSYPVSFDTSSLLTNVYSTLKQDLESSRSEYELSITINNNKIASMISKASEQEIQEEIETLLFEALEAIEEERLLYNKSVFLDGVRSVDIINQIETIFIEVAIENENYKVDSQKCKNEIKTKQSLIDYQNNILIDLDTIEQQLQSIDNSHGNNTVKSNLDILEKEINIPLEIYEPVKELYWIIQDSHFYDKRNPFHRNLWTAFHTPGVKHNHSFKNASISFDNDQQAKHSADFFKHMKQYNHKTRMNKHNVYNYSFALKPDELQPSGSLTPAAYSDFKFVMEMNDKMRNYKLVTVFAKVHNIFVIENGKGFLEYM